MTKDLSEGSTLDTQLGQGSGQGSSMTKDLSEGSTMDTQLGQ